MDIEKRGRNIIYEQNDYEKHVKNLLHKNQSIWCMMEMTESDKKKRR